MRVLVVNCNTSAEITGVIRANAQAAARPGTEVVAIQPSWGPESAEGFYESFVTAAAVLDAVLAHDGTFDAVVMAGYGEHGREGMRQVLDVPVVDITEASAQFASLLSYRFGVATTAVSAVAGIEESLRSAGLWSRCAGVVATRIPVVAIHQDSGLAIDALVEAGRTLLDSGADSIVLGCAGFAGLDRRLEEVLGVPVLDGVTCAVAVAEGLVGLGKTTSKQGPFRAPSGTKTWAGWPRRAVGKIAGVADG
ncbi:aspartate/glutamate racemase family protein [Amycolatopsis sp. GM8]|uniref:aspartate/glutamate racemase family protein n=1 Tax=Amycolatopsis sp. GM8 TaxID=2896530 RepID=UPI001F015D88|nr:aspartate/glutamate racemase family protein [Amycolatopsis sp. GM8]